MLPAMIFAADADALARIQRRCAGASFIKLFQVSAERPSLNDMLRLIRAYHPELVLIEFQDRADALSTEATLRAELPKLGILGFADSWQYEPILRTVRGHLRVVSASVAFEEFQECVLDAMEVVQSGLPDNMTVFLPSKAGSGASTVALNVAGAIADSCGKSAVLIEADLHSGPASMYVKVNSKHSVLDALQESGWLDSYWSELSVQDSNVAILPATKLPASSSQLPSQWEYRRLTSVARSRFDHVIFDLPEVVNPATEAVVLKARTVFIVCTPEVPSLTLARRRRSTLTSLGLPEERLKIVLNRCTKNGPELSAVEEIIGRKIDETIPNDYQAVWSANLRQQLVDPKTPPGRAFASFAGRLTGAPSASRQRKFFGIFGSAASLV